MRSLKIHKSLKNTEADFTKLRNFLKVTVLVNQDLNLGCPMPKSTVTFGIILVLKKIHWTVETKIVLVGAQSWRDGVEVGEMLKLQYIWVVEEWFGGNFDGKILKLGCGDGCTALNIRKPWSCIRSKWLSCMICEFYLEEAVKPTEN